MYASVLTFPPASESVPSLATKVRDLRTAIWLTPFIIDGDTRTRLLQLADELAADLRVRHSAAVPGGVR